MATIPIAATNFSAPISVVHENVTDILESAGNNLTVVQRGGHRFRYTPTPFPINILSNPDRADLIETFLELNPTFEIPILNRQSVSTSGVIDVRVAGAVGDPSVEVQYASSGTPSLPVGSYIVFSNKSKMYRIQAETRGGGSADATWTLTHPLRQALTISETVTYTGIDGLSNSFNGVIASFVNGNFGRPQTSMADGVLLEFRRMDLLENI